MRSELGKMTFITITSGLIFKLCTHLGIEYMLFNSQKAIQIINNIFQILILRSLRY